MSTRVSLADLAEATGIAIDLLAAEMGVLQRTPALVSCAVEREARAKAHASTPTAGGATSPARPRRTSRSHAIRTRVAA